MIHAFDRSVRRHHVAHDVTASGVGRHQTLGQPTNQRLQLAFVNEVELNTLTRGETQSAISEPIGQRINGQPLLGRQHPARHRTPDHARVGQRFLRLGQPTSKVPVVLLVDAVKLEQLPSIGRKRKVARREFVQDGSSVQPDIDVVFIDTGYHFPETLDTLRSIERRYRIEIDIVGPIEPTRSNIEPGACCASKVELLDQALADRNGWISGISRVQTVEREDTSLVEVDRRGKVKFNPLAQWNQHDRDAYISRHELIEHPLRTAGYSSIGCAPCTSAPNNLDPRSGRWAGTEQTECGLHL